LEVWGCLRSRKNVRGAALNLLPPARFKESGRGCIDGPFVRALILGSNGDRQVGARSRGPSCGARNCMPLRFFAVPALDPREAEAELNGFLRSHRVVAIERRFSEGPQGRLWFLAVEPLAVPEGPRAPHPSCSHDIVRAIPLSSLRPPSPLASPARPCQAAISNFLSARLPVRGRVR
jgi:hypothetical protein